MKYVDSMVTFREVPDEITLSIDISNCQIGCKGCHSKYLWKDIGTELTTEELDKLIDANTGITCVAILGGDSAINDVIKSLKHIKERGLKSCWYSGRFLTPGNILKYLDFIKLGPYNAECGGLDKPTTNQRFYEVRNQQLFDITKKFYDTVRT